MLRAPGTLVEGLGLGLKSGTQRARKSMHQYHRHTCGACHGLYGGTRVLMCLRSEADTMQSQELCVVCKEEEYLG